MIAGAVAIARLQRLGDLNLAEFMRRMNRAEHGRIGEHDGLVLVAAEHPNPGPYRNAALLVNDELAAQTALEQALDFFTGRGFVFWIREHGHDDRQVEQLLLGRRYRPLEAELPQIWHRGPPDPADLPADVVIRWTTDEETRRDFVQVNAAAWGIGDLPADLSYRMICGPQFLDDPPDINGAVAYLDGAPASTLMALAYPDTVVGGYWGATAPWARGHHLFDLTTRTALRNALLHHPAAEAVVCQNSPGSAETFRRMHFERLTSYRRYLVPATH